MTPDFDRLDPEWLASKPGIKWSRCGEDVVAAWVADMDFPPSPGVTAALSAYLSTGDLGYPDWTDGNPLQESFAKRMADRHRWAIEPSHVHVFTDILNAVQAVLHLHAGPGDGVALHVPAYPPFFDTISRLGLRLIPIPLELHEDGWRHDPVQFRRAMSQASVLILVNPHNPTGTAFDRVALAEIAETAIAHRVLVISDEVHADLVYPPRRHLPIASLGEEVAASTVTVTSATKAFNLASIRCAVAHVGPEPLRTRLVGLPEHLFGVVGAFGVVATVAAWSDDEQWSDLLISHLDRNRRRLDTLLAPTPIRYRLPDATYLAWLDCTDLGMGADPAGVMLERRRVRLSPGPDFGPGGAGWARLNFATSATMLEATVRRVLGALDET